MSNSIYDYTNWDLDYKDITSIFKNSLKIENTLKSIQSIFLNKRFADRIDYKPYFQRNYVWDGEKASYFIESILLGTEIPPLVMFKSSQNNEVIDGRQRYETLMKFIENETTLQGKGLQYLSTFSGCRYVDLDDETIDAFNNTKLRILQCSVSNEPSLSSEKEDKIKKEIFKRYNSGITPLKKEENARAQFMGEPISEAFKKRFEDKPGLLRLSEDLFLPKSMHLAAERDKLNIVLDRVRTLLALAEVPISDYAKSAHRYDIVNRFYELEIKKGNEEEIIEQYIRIIELLEYTRDFFPQNISFNNNLFYECLFWAISISLRQNKTINQEEIILLADDIMASKDKEYFWSNIRNADKTPEAIFQMTGSHYRNAVIDRYQFTSNYFSTKYGTDFHSNLKNLEKFNSIMSTEIPKKQLERLRLIKPDPVSVTVDDILADMRQNKFLVRPKYQRSEVKNIAKSSYLLESIMLGIKIPPIYIYRRIDKVKEVIDGQQRILTILGFLGETYIDENGKKKTSDKHKFKLSGLKILKELNGLNVDSIRDKYPEYIDNILDFSIDVVEIDAKQNPDFNSIDLFLRLNTKPFPIKANTFEMWNAYVAKDITQRIKDIAIKYEGSIFRAKDTRMSNEELITALAYLSYQTTYKRNKYADLLSFYVRNTKACSRISSKDRITKMLESFTSGDTINFVTSIDEVEKFIKKICSILGEHGEKMPQIFGTRHKTDQNFYFLWVLLNNVTLDLITAKNTQLFVALKNAFSMINEMNGEFEPSQFAETLSNYCQENIK